MDLSLVGSHWVTEYSRGPFPDEEDSWLLGLCWGCQGERWEPAAGQSVYPMPGSTGERGSHVPQPLCDLHKIPAFSSTPPKCRQETDHEGNGLQKHSAKPTWRHPSVTVGKSPLAGSKTMRQLDMLCLKSGSKKDEVRRLGHTPFYAFLVSSPRDDITHAQSQRQGSPNLN